MHGTGRCPPPDSVKPLCHPSSGLRAPPRPAPNALPTSIAMQYFQKLIQKDLGFSHALADPIASHDRADIWTLHHGKSKENGEPSLVFHFDAAKASPNASRNLQLAKTGVMRLKTLRHPDVLKFLSSVEGSDGTLYVATEPAIPLATILANNPATIDRETAQWGLFTIARALGFMHSSGLIHGRLNPSTVFVTPTGDWKLGGLECVASHTSPSSLAQNATSLQPHAYQSPEFSHANWSSVAAAAPSAVDSWALGCLMYEAHAGSLTSPDQLQSISSLPKPILSAYQKLLASNPSNRAPAGQLPNHPYFTNSKFVELNLFVENLALKGQLEREAFLTKLPTIMDRLPDGFCTYKILPMLSQSIETATAGSAAFACVVKMKDRLTAQDFADTIVHKYATQWFANTNLDRNLRVELYTNLDLFIAHFDDNAINNVVFPALSASFQDMQAPALRDAAVKSVLTIGNRLTDKNLNSVLMSHFARLQVDPEPAIRTNTTVCLGKIAPKLSVAARNKVLAAAFIRSLKDPFPPARAAGVNAILITTGMYNAKDMATRMLPAIVPLLVDSSSEVRKIGFRVLNDFQERLNKNHEEMSRSEASAAATAGPQNGASNGAAMGNAGGAAGNSGWGLSTFTSMTAALLSKTDSTPGVGGPSSTSTGISSEDFRKGRTPSAPIRSTVASSVQSSAVGNANSGAMNAGIPTGTSSFSSDTWGNGNGSVERNIPASFSASKLPVGNSISVNSFASFGNESGEGIGLDDDDDDDDGWGDMDLKGADKEVDEEDLMVSMLGKPPSKAGKPAIVPGGMGRGSTAVKKPAVKSDGGDLWDLAPPQVSKPKPKPRAAPRMGAARGGGMRGGASRRGNAGTGDDWEALLGGTGTGTGSRRKATGRGAGSR